MAQILAHVARSQQPRLRSRFLLEGWSWFALTLMAGLFTVLTGQLVVGLAFVFLACVSAVVLGYWVLSGLVHLDISRQLSATEVEYGGSLQQVVTCRPRNLLSRLVAPFLSIEVADEHVVPGMETSGVVGAIGADGTLHDRRTVDACTRWGVFAQGQTRIKIPGIIDTFERRRGASDVAWVAVLPPCVPLPSCWLDSVLFQDQFVQQFLHADDPFSSRQRQPPVIAGTRRYRSGDSLRLVYDRKYVRTHDPRDLRTIVYARPPALTRIWLALDTGIDPVHFSAAGAIYVQQTLAVAALALAGHWLEHPELEVGVLAGTVGMTDVYRGEEQSLTYKGRIRQIQQLLARTSPQPPSTRAREQLVNQLSSRIAGGQRGVWGQAAAIEVVVILTANNPSQWQTELADLQDRGIRTAVVDGSMVEQHWPVPAIDLLPHHLSTVRLPATQNGWGDLMHALTRPTSGESFKRRAVGA